MKSYSLINLREMQEFYAEKFTKITKALSMLEVILVDPEELMPGGLPDLRTWLQQTVVPALIEIELHVTAKQAERILARFAEQSDPKHLSEGLLYALKELMERIALELEDIFFLQLSSAEAALYESKDQFGPEVTLKFPSARIDIDEAHRCIALGRYTASVFHLMRVMEIALYAVSACLGVPDPVSGNDKTWGTILRKIRKEYMERPNFSEMELFQELYARLCAVRDAWRNQTMHVENNYGEAEARSILHHVKGFMAKLAARMDEKGLPLA